MITSVRAKMAIPAPTVIYRLLTANFNVSALTVAPVKAADTTLQIGLNVAITEEVILDVTPRALIVLLKE